ncbi:MAG TPA: NUDIX domain-containing protein [Anaerolineae bacterium]|nr:NUDIX domain-containing protein [Anaerolineae bacterium]
MTEYVRWLRRYIGRAKTPLVYASMLIPDERGALLFQRRADFGDAWWGLPGGLLELGESITQTAIREAREETGLIVNPTRLVGLYTSPDFDVTYPNGDQVQQITACFACQQIGGQLRAQADEILELRYFPLDALPPLPSWYAAMVADFAAGRAEASFQSGSAGRDADPDNRTYAEIRQVVGPEPLIVVAATAFVQHEGRILMQQRGDNGRWGLPGGSLELGERIDQTAVREAREETGVAVEPVRLIGIYSAPRPIVPPAQRPGSQIFLAYLECRPIGGAPRADGVESIDARYFTPRALPLEISNLWRMYIADALAGRREAIVR